jgi:hypothetical protein
MMMKGTGYLVGNVATDPGTVRKSKPSDLDNSIGRRLVKHSDTYSEYSTVV